MEERKQIVISDVIEMMENGVTREEIGDHYDLRAFERTELFKHPQLKGRRIKPKISFVIIDDITEADQIPNEEVTTPSEVQEERENTDLESQIPELQAEVSESDPASEEMWDITATEAENNMESPSTEEVTELPNWNN